MLLPQINHLTSEFKIIWINVCFLVSAPIVKQRGDQTIKSEEYAEDDLVAPSIETEIFTSKKNPDTKKNEVEVSKDIEGKLYIIGCLSLVSLICWY